MAGKKKKGSKVAEVSEQEAPVKGRRLTVHVELTEAELELVESRQRTPEGYRVPRAEIVRTALRRGLQA